MQRLLLTFAAALLAVSAPLQAQSSARGQLSGAEIFERYREAVQHQAETTRDVAMEVTMEASIPKLKKHGTLNALRRISSLGKITYKVLGFSGDDTVKKEVMARYMTAEVEAAQKLKDDMGISSENYNWKYKGENDKQGQRVHVFELKPKQKRVGLFKGELWVDPETFLPVRESGRLVKNPSVFVKRMEFVRDYEIRDGVAWLVRLDSTTDTRIVGKAELHIAYAQATEVQAEDSPVEEARR